MTGEQGRNLGLDGLRQQRSGAAAQHLGQRIGKVPGWVAARGPIQNLIAGQLNARKVSTANGGP